MRKEAWQIDAAAIGVLALTTLGGYAGGVGPSIRERAAAMDERGALALAITSAAEAEKDAVIAQAALKELVREVEQKAIDLQPVDALNSRLGALTRLTGECGVAVDEIAPRPPEGGTGVRLSTRVPIHIQGRGGFADVTKFIERVHAEHRDTAVEGITLNAENGVGDGSARFSVDLIWHAAPIGAGK